ncbi:hypothetical protein DPMN_027012 [Dreissena polymorpha]|uniref:Uncharacterized protein n=1 Tax=Dreissena polymorpha TaxID=45954 RepID=A0A9D4REV2_DREPO|nr:hypothetical protein DPMN_027012 [Dreissena polymorpha]
MHPPPGGPGTNQHHFKLVQDIIGMNPLIKFHEDQTNNVASRVLTRFYYRHIYSHIWKNAPPLGSYVFQAKVYYSHIKKNAPPFGSHVFQANDIMETNLLTKFHEDLDNKCGL